MCSYSNKETMQIVITREHVAVPWGFRLKGGAEYNVPLSILKVRLNFNRFELKVGKFYAIECSRSFGGVTFLFC